MKRMLFKSITALALVLGVQQSASAKIHVVHVANDFFTPKNITAADNFVVGDTIRWVWDQGVHTTTSAVIPAGAATWDKVMASAADSFDYVPTVAGTYNYVCTPHVSMGMVGSFVVVTPNSVAKIAGASFAISPNPARTQVTIKSDAKGMNVSLMDATGRLVRELGQVGNTATEKVFSVQGIAPGMYLLRVTTEGGSATERLVIE